jgi:RNA polymerase sigma-70 factor (sigma-E family)
MIVQATQYSSEPLPPPPPPTLRVVRVDSTIDDARQGVVELYRANYRTMARLAYLLCGDTYQADDLAHDAFVTMYEHWDDVRDDEARIAYLRACVVNRARSSHRRKATTARHDAAPRKWMGESLGASAEDAALGRANRSEVAAALAHLSDKQRTAVVLRFWMRMTESEIAEAMGCSVGSVRTHISRGQARLAISLGGLR